MAGVNARLVQPPGALSTGVVPSQMVVTLALEADEARWGAAGAEAAPEEERLVLLVPKLDGPRRAGRDGRPDRARGDLPNGVLPWYCVPCTALVHTGVAGTGGAVGGCRPGP